VIGIEDTFVVRDGEPEKLTDCPTEFYPLDSRGRVISPKSIVCNWINPL